MNTGKEPLIGSFQRNVLRISNADITLRCDATDSSAEPEAVFAGEVKKMQAEKMKPQEQVTVDLTLGGRVLNWIANLVI